MKLTKQLLKQLIKEELQKTLNEGEEYPDIVLSDEGDEKTVILKYNKFLRWADYNKGYNCFVVVDPKIGGKELPVDLLSHLWQKLGISLKRSGASPPPTIDPEEVQKQKEQIVAAVLEKAGAPKERTPPAPRSGYHVSMYDRMHRLDRNN